MRVRTDKPTAEWLKHHRISLFHEARSNNNRIGQVLRFADHCTVEPYCSFRGVSLCSMGHGSYSNSELDIGFTVGRFCSIATGLSLPFFRHPTEYALMSEFLYAQNSAWVNWYAKDHGLDGLQKYNIPQKPRPRVGHDVWIGANVTLLQGVTIGNGSVIAAGSIVAKPVGEYEICGGNPARLIKKRFPEEVIERLRAADWWRYRLVDFRDIPMNDPEVFAEKFMQRKGGLAPYEPDRIILRDMPGERVALG